MNIHHEVTFNTSPERVYELLTNGAKFGDVTGQPGKGGGSTGAFFSLCDGWLQGRQVELVPNELIAQALALHGLGRGSLFDGSLQGGP
jgi:uncharacterized protein YndB with AHSA1/START domain